MGGSELQDGEYLEALAQELRQAREALERARAEGRQATEELRASEEFKSRLIACSRDCIKVLDLDGLLLFVNEGGLQELEICDLAPFLNQPWVNFWHGDDRQAAVATVEAARSGTVGRFTGYFPTVGSSKPRWWDVMVGPIRDSAGKPERLLAVSRDITEAKLAEIALREAYQLNQQIIEGAAQGIIVYDSDPRYRVFNPFMQKLTGKREDEVLGRVAAEAFPRLRTYGVEALLRRALSGEVVHAEDLLVERHAVGGRDVWECCTFAPHLNARGEIVGVIALVNDMTDRHVAEETLRSIVVGTAAATGSEFFPSLVRHMAGALRVRYAYIAECDDQKRARSLAFWNASDLAPNFEYDIAGTPCERVAQGETCYFRKGLPAAFPENQHIVRMGAQSYLGVPMLDLSGNVLGHVVIVDDKPMDCDARSIDLVRIFAARAAAELKRQPAEAAREAALEQVRLLQQKLEAENVYLQEEIHREHNFEEIVGRSPALLDVLRMVETAAPTDSTVLILGETGFGKELIALAVHNRSRRKHRSLVKLNCGAIPTGLVESELFGHMKGAFTGALEKRAGRFELADGGTLFLDEISELPLETQVKLLRVLQEHEFEPLGSSRTIQVNVRIIAASNRNLDQAVREGRFRADLYYHLNVLPITLPPLRQRRSDIPLLASFFVERYTRQLANASAGSARKPWIGFPPTNGRATSANCRTSSSAPWCSARARCCGWAPVFFLPGARPLSRKRPPPTDAGTGLSLEEVERWHILEILRQAEWVIEASRGAAGILGLTRIRCAAE